MPKLHIAKLRFYILLLLAVFVADILSANASLHLPVSHAHHEQQTLNAQPGAAHNVHMHADAAAMSQHHEHPLAMVKAANQTEKQHAGKCGTCHDCLSCFSAMPLSLQQLATALPQRHQAASLHRHYYPPAIAQLQRPPILPLV